MKKLPYFLIGSLLLICCYFVYQHFQTKKELDEVKRQLEMAQSPFNNVANDADPDFQERDDVVKGDITSATFDKLSHNYGKIQEGQSYHTVFKIKNTGQKPLYISDAIGSCGCTVPEYSKEPIAPGVEGELQVTFDAKGKEGEQTKTVTVVTNTKPSQTVLTITANVSR